MEPEVIMVLFKFAHACATHDSVHLSLREITW